MNIAFTVFSQFTKQMLSNFQHKNFENISNFEGEDLTLVACKKKASHVNVNVNFN